MRQGLVLAAFALLLALLLGGVTIARSIGCERTAIKMNVDWTFHPSTGCMVQVREWYTAHEAARQKALQQ